MTQHILIIDDDTRRSAMVADYLRGQGYQVETAPDATSGLLRLAQGGIDALVLDLMLPDADGLDVCRRIRNDSDLPILMLTARGELTDRVVGLELGADDYLPKPFEPRELLARLRAVLRRRPGATPTIGSRVLRVGDLEIDRDARVVRLHGKTCLLTGYQFDLLLALADQAGRVLSRDQLMDHVKGEQLEAFDRSIDVHISRIRAAIEDDPKQPRYVQTVRGVGYVLARPGETV